MTMVPASSETTVDIEYRPALPTDSRDIARFICIAGGGLYEFLFDDLAPLLSAVDFLTIGVWNDDYPISYRNCFVAIDRANGEMVGAANAFPADDLHEQEYPLVPVDRQEHIRSLLQLRDRGSMFLNSLAVSERYRGLGVGARLLSWSQERAVAGGHDRLSLHVWADNVRAVKFYGVRGFVELATASVADHHRLQHTRSILMHQILVSGGALPSLRSGENPT